MARADGLAEDLNDEEDDADSVSAGVPADGDAEEGEEEEVSASSPAAGGGVSCKHGTKRVQTGGVVHHCSFKVLAMLVHNVRMAT